jgi:formylglycine-generating enzyme required for sulfatase activity
MGSKEGEGYDWGRPQFDCDSVTKPFAISRYPLTVAQYQAFVDAGGYSERKFWTDLGWKWKQVKKVNGPEDYDAVFQTANHPRVGVSWFEAIAFCGWLAERMKKPVTLPSEAEWERAARHKDGRVFPWGNEQQRGLRRGGYGGERVGVDTEPLGQRLQPRFPLPVR